MIGLDNVKTHAVQARYDRMAPFYDRMEGLAERRYGSWRERAWALVQGLRVLEVGVGTGKNIPYYPPDAQMTGIDLSERMLARARLKAERLGRQVALSQMDAQTLMFADDIFDSAIATFVFCSVPDPVLGLQEMKRVVKPGGHIVLLEHMRAKIPFLGYLMDVLDPLTSGLMGPHINRETVENVRRAGLKVEQVEELDAWGIFRLIVARV